MIFDFGQGKNEALFRERGITFQDIIDAINERGVLKEFKHPNDVDYPNQRVLIVDLNGYPYFVPYVFNDDVFFLKTAYPARGYKHLLESQNE